MAGNGSSGQVSFDAMASYARLNERVEGQSRDLVDLRSNMNTGFQRVGSDINSLANEIRGNSRTQWPVIWSAVGVCFAVVVGIGSAVYVPIRENIAEAKSDIRSLGDSSLSVNAFVDFKNTYENNRIVSRNEYIDKFSQINARLEKIDSVTVPRAEHERTWLNYDQRVEDIQRQIDDIKTVQGSVYNQRDVIRDILERLDRAEARNRAAGNVMGPS